MSAEELRPDRTPLGDRAIAAAYLTTVGVAMIGWLYLIGRAALAAASSLLG